MVLLEVRGFTKPLWGLTTAHTLLVTHGNMIAHSWITAPCQNWMPGGEDVGHINSQHSIHELNEVSVLFIWIVSVIEYFSSKATSMYHSCNNCCYIEGCDPQWMLFLGTKQRYTNWYKVYACMHAYNLSLGLLGCSPPYRPEFRKSTL